MAGNWERKRELEEMVGWSERAWRDPAAFRAWGEAGLVHVRAAATPATQVRKGNGHDRRDTVVQVTVTISHVDTGAVVDCGDRCTQPQCSCVRGGLPR